MLVAILIANITLTPVGDYMGKIEMTRQTCQASFSPGAVLAPGTRLDVKVPIETYGEGSVLGRGDGMTCGDCYVRSFSYIGNNEYEIRCEVGK